MPRFTLSKRSKKNREGIDPRLIEISDLAITITLIDFGHGSYAGLREATTQNGLFIAGKSKADGYVNKSNHQAAEDGYGKALDFYAYIDGKASWKREQLAMVAAAFLQAASMLGYKVTWGGLWKSSKHPYYGWDMPHIQLLD